MPLKPTEKAPAIDKLISDTMGKDRKAIIGANKCMTCSHTFDNPATEFRNAISTKEYRISGMCQKCQDSIFGAD